MIKKIEVICKPCRKCKLMIERLEHIINCLECQYKAKIKYELKHNHDVRDAEKHGYNASQLPLVLINGYVEFVGHVKEEGLIRTKLDSILRGL